MRNHIADAEATFMVINITPDFCRVDGEVIPFDIVQLLPPEKVSYSPNVRARGEKVLMVDSIIAGVKGNAGEGVESGVSLDAGHTLLIEGDDNVFANGSKVSRHGDRCLMNVKVG